MRINRLFAIDHTKVTRLSDLLNTAVAGEQLAPIYVNRIFFQMRAGSAGLGFVFIGVPNGVTPALPVAPANGAGETTWLTAELGASPSAAQPGGALSDGIAGNGSLGGVLNGADDITRIWVGGSNDGDLMLVSWDLVD